VSLFRVSLFRVTWQATSVIVLSDIAGYAISVIV